MLEFLVYLSKVSLCIILFYLMYICILQNFTFFKINRFFLLSGLVLSFVLPVLRLNVFNSQSLAIVPSVLDIDYFNSEPVIVKSLNISTFSNPISYLFILYLSGSVFFFSRLIYSTFSLTRISGGLYGLAGKSKIIRKKTVLPFSFFNRIFLPEDEVEPVIIAHERAHINQLHWIDLLLAELSLILLWFNPIVFLYRRSIKIQHEFLADADVLKNTSDVSGYLNCMLQHVTVVTNARLSIHFFCKTIKKRIVMITKNKTSKYWLGAYFLVLPLICILMLAFTPENNNSILKSDEKLQFVSNVPSGFPIQKSSIKNSVGFGEWIHPITHKKDFHYGVDFAVQEGEAVVATANGKVIEAKYDDKKGNYVLIQHNPEFVTFYSHLKSLTVKTGDEAIKGQKIGLVGSTGLSTGPHVHYEVIKNGVRVNPELYLYE